MAAQIRARAGQKSTGETTGRRSARLPALIPQPHGGALRTGGTPGNRGGAGRPSSEIRARLRGSFDARVAILEEIADATVPLRGKCEHCGEVTIAKAETGEEVKAPEQPSYADRLRSLDIMAKIGLEDEADIPAGEVRRRLTRTMDVIREILAPDMARGLIDALRPVWA